MPAFAAFAAYRDFGTERSLGQVQQKVNKSYRLMARWSSQWNWVERAKAYDAHIDSIRLAAREQSSAKHAAKIMSADEVKQGLTQIAEFDIAEVFEPDGTFNLQSAKSRGATKKIKSLSFDKDTGKVTKIEAYSAHEGYRDMGKTHAIFVDKSETEDKTPLTPDTLKALQTLAEKFFGYKPEEAELQKLLDESFARAGEAKDLNTIG